MKALDKPERAKLADAFHRIERHGLDESGVDAKPFEGQLKEIRVDAHRAFFVLVLGDTMVVLHAYRKKSQKAPVREIAIARSRMEAVLAR